MLYGTLRTARKISVAEPKPKSKLGDPVLKPPKGGSSATLIFSEVPKFGVAFSASVHWKFNKLFNINS